MKKRMFLIVAMLVMAMTMSAQSIVGKWKTTMDADGQKVDCIFHFKDNGELMLTMRASAAIEEASFDIKATVSGNYSLEGKVLTTKFTSSSATMNVENMKFSGEMETYLTLMPDLRKQLEDEINKDLESSKTELVEELTSGIDQTTVKTLTQTTLVLDDGSEVVTLQRVD